MTDGPPGPLAEEAARLAEAIGEWARGTIGGAPLSAMGDGAECQICPVCQLLALLRRTQPETFGHLADASASLIAALRTVVERHDHGDRRAGVERIDLDERDEPPASEPGAPRAPAAGVPLDPLDPRDAHGLAT